MQISEFRLELDRSSRTVDARSLQDEQSMSLTLWAFSRENQLICFGVHRPDRTLSMFPHCHSRLDAQSSASSITSTSMTRRSTSSHACEEVAFMDGTTDRWVDGVTTVEALRAGGWRTLIHARACSHRGFFERDGMVRSSLSSITEVLLSVDGRGAGS